APPAVPPLEALLPARARRQGRPPAREARHSDPHDGPRALAGPASAVPPPSAPYHFEARAWRTGVVRVAGVDEAGRGPLAGPVVAAAVVIGPDRRINRLPTSKLLTPYPRAHSS